MSKIFIAQNNENDVTWEALTTSSLSVKQAIESAKFISNTISSFLVYLRAMPNATKAT